MSSIGNPIKATKAELARRAARANRFAAEAKDAETKFAPPPKAVAHPDGSARTHGDVRASLIAAVKIRLASGEDLTDAQRAALARHGVSESEYAVPSPVYIDAGVKCGGAKSARHISTSVLPSRLISNGNAGGGGAAARTVLAAAGAGAASGEDTKRLRALEKRARAIAELAARPTRELTPEQIVMLSSSFEVDAAITQLHAKGVA